MGYPFFGVYASFFKILAKYHYGNVMSPRIKVEIIYGSEGGNSYELAKEFVTEFIETFKHIDFLLNEIEQASKNSAYKIENLEKETTKYFRNYLKYISSFLKGTKKNQFEELDKEYEKRRKEEKDAQLQQQKGAQKNEQQKKRRKKKREFKKRVRRRSKRKEPFRNYIDYKLQSNRVSLTVDFKCGNDFKINTFIDQTKFYDLNLLLFFVSTYADGSFPNNAEQLEKELSFLESNVFQGGMIENTFYSCVGFGNKLYGDNEFCKPIVECDMVCSGKMNRFNRTIKICETENVEEIFFDWKVEVIKIMFLSIYIYYSYSNFMQSHTIFSVSPWSGPICLNNCCLLFSYDPFIQKNKSYRNGSLRCRYSERSEALREQLQTEYVFLEKKTGPFEIFQKKNKNDEESEEVTDPYENCLQEQPSRCCNSKRNSKTNSSTNSNTKTKSCSCQTERNDKCGDTYKESQSDVATDDIDNLNELTDVNDDFIQTGKNVGGCDSDDMEDLLQEKKNREMLTLNQRDKLTKEGYKIIGSHSAVKLCRWTKSQLRGRGGCYKNCFYGIISYQCMETTPSLACANKCVFCWRHHKNPVGTEWVWKLDDPQFIVNEGIEKHRKMIKELRGAHGVIPERFEAAFNVRHCALSLVGEPIMYPKINKLINELHSRHISTFLVTNAQFPEALRGLKQVTQLYVSIDASTEEQLKKIDRPLFKDFWKRYIECIQILRNRKERTVFRFTLVKEYNMMANEMSGYCQLVKLGFPDFIEIKAATYCGSSNGYQLTMKNIPWYDEVCQFATSLIQETFFLREHYEVACQHKHSCSVLIAKKKFKINNKWHTWIDYDKFHELVKKKKQFDALEYCAETPQWALCGSKAEGFNPMDVRVYTKGKQKQSTRC